MSQTELSMFLPADRLPSHASSDQSMQFCRYSLVQSDTVPIPGPPAAQVLPDPCPCGSRCREPTRCGTSRSTLVCHPLCTDTTIPAICLLFSSLCQHYQNASFVHPKPVAKLPPATQPISTYPGLCIKRKRLSGHKHSRCIFASVRSVI